jgi:hypothetical protein
MSKTGTSIGKLDDGFANQGENSLKINAKIVTS